MTVIQLAASVRQTQLDSWRADYIEQNKKYNFKKIINFSTFSFDRFTVS